MGIQKKKRLFRIFSEKEEKWLRTNPMSTPQDSWVRMGFQIRYDSHVWCTGARLGVNILCWGPEYDFGSN